MQVFCFYWLKAPHSGLFSSREADSDRHDLSDNINLSSSNESSEVFMRVIESFIQNNKKKRNVFFLIESNRSGHTTIRSTLSRCSPAPGFKPTTSNSSRATTNSYTNVKLKVQWSIQNNGRTMRTITKNISTYPHICPPRIFASPPYHSWQDPGLPYTICVSTTPWSTMVCLIYQLCNTSSPAATSLLSFGFQTCDVTVSGCLWQPTAVLAAPLSGIEAEGVTPAWSRWRLSYSINCGHACRQWQRRKGLIFCCNT